MTDCERRDIGDPERPNVRMRELIALGLLGVEGLVILGYVAAAIANQAQLDGSQFSDMGAHVWGSTLTLAAGWAAPPAVVVFLFAPLALVTWMNPDGGRVPDQRAGLVLTLGLALAILTIIGGIVSIVGHVLFISPSEQWSSFLLTLGNGLGSVALGLLAVTVIKRLADGLPIRRSRSQE